MVWERKRRGAIRRSRTLLVCGAVLAFAGASTASAAGDASSPARAARTIALNETGRLHLTSHHHLTLNEQGAATGTVKGTIYIHLNIVSLNHVTAEVNIYPSGGSISGSASASYRAGGATASFTGTMSVTHGTGRYARVHGTGLSFTGTIARADDAVTVHLVGQLSQ